MSAQKIMKSVPKPAKIRPSVPTTHDFVHVSLKIILLFSLLEGSANHHSRGI